MDMKLFMALIIVSTVLNASSQPAQADLRFEAASIRPSNSNDRRPLFDYKPELLRVANVPVKRLIEVAYGIKSFQIIDGPDWIGSDLFDISAKPPSPSKPDQLNVMLQHLLAERCQLVVKRATREMPIYGLVVAKGGPKFHESTHSGPPMMKIRRGLLVTQALPLPAVTGELSSVLERTVVDRTGLTGKYDLKLEWTPDEYQVAMFQNMGVPEGFGAPTDTLGPSLFAALQEQLGLRLESQRGPVEVLAIERIGKPAAN